MARPPPLLGACRGRLGPDGLLPEFHRARRPRVRCGRQSLVPQPDLSPARRPHHCLRAPAAACKGLRDTFCGKRRHIVGAAIGDVACAAMPMYVNGADVLSTLSPGWIAAMKRSERFRGLETWEDNPDDFGAGRDARQRDRRPRCAGVHEDRCRGLRAAGAEGTQHAIRSLPAPRGHRESARSMVQSALAPGRGRGGLPRYHSWRGR
jgi:hypothetical protein